MMKSKTPIIFSLLFYAIFYLYLLLIIKPELIFHYQQLGFSFDKYSLMEYLSFPGGIAECASLFLFQFNINPYSGALLYTLLTFLIIRLTGNIISRYQHKPGNIYYIAKYLPGVLIAGLLANYSFLTVFVFTVLLLLLFVYSFIRIVSKYNNLSIRVISFIVLSGLTYYISGGLAFLIFTFSSLIYILSKREIRSVAIIIVIVITTILIPLLASRFIFFITVDSAYFRLIPQYQVYEPGVLLYGFYFYLPFIILFLAISGAISGQKDSDSEQEEKPGKLLWIQYIILLAVFSGIIILKFNKEERHKISVDYYSYYKQWDKILELVKQNPSDDRLVQFHTNRALYHKGLLSQSMFEYPQIWGVDGLFLSRYLIPGVLLPTTELYIDLGHVNDAIHWGNEAYSQNENSPQILELLVISNIIEANYKSAELYINSLKKYLFYKKKAGEYEQYINNENIPEISILVKEKRAVMPVKDFSVDRNLPYRDLIRLLEDNSHNKMAFEYLMVYFLLDNDLASFIKYFDYSKNIGYRPMPKVYEEAFTLYAFELQKTGKRISGLRISKNTIDRFTDYITTLGKYRGNKENAREELENKYGNTYWFYIHYISPVTTRKKIIIK